MDLNVWSQKEILVKNPDQWWKLKEMQIPACVDNYHCKYFKTPACLGRQRNIKLLKLNCLLVFKELVVLSLYERNITLDLLYIIQILTLGPSFNLKLTKNINGDIDADLFSY